MVQHIRGGDHHQVNIRPLHETLPGRLQGPLGEPQLRRQGEQPLPAPGAESPQRHPWSQLGDHPGVVGPPAGADDPYPDGLHVRTPRRTYNCPCATTVQRERWWGWRRMQTMLKTNGTRRGLLLAGTATGAGLLSLACGPAGAGQGAPAGRRRRAQVVFMSQGTDPDDQERYKPLVDQYNATGGKVKIDLIQGDAGGSAVDRPGQGDRHGGLRDGAGRLLDPRLRLAQSAASSGVLEDINPYIKRDKDFKASNYFEAPFKDYEADGKQYGVPREATTTIMIINKELFQKSGVALPSRHLDLGRLPQGRAADDPRGRQRQDLGRRRLRRPRLRPLLRLHQGLAGGGRHRGQDAHQVHPAPDPGGGADAVGRPTWSPATGCTPTGTSSPGPTAREVWNSGRIGMFVQISVYTNFNQAQFDWDIVPLPRGKTQVTRTASAGHSMTAAEQEQGRRLGGAEGPRQQAGLRALGQARADHPHLQGGGGEPAGAEPQRPAQERQDRHGRLRLRPPRADQRGLGQRGRRRSARR